MSSAKRRRDYSLTGKENQRAQDRGLVTTEWYTSPIPRQRMKELMKRKDGPAIRDTIILFVLLIGTGILAYYSWGTWWAVPAFLSMAHCTLPREIRVGMNAGMGRPLRHLG